MTKKKEDLGGVWRTVGGRRIFIKDGQDLYEAMNDSGKFTNLKKTNSQRKAKERTTSQVDKEYELYKKAREDENSIDPMTENSTDWEELDRKYKDRYEKEKSSIKENKKIDDFVKNNPDWEFGRYDEDEFDDLADTLGIDRNNVAEEIYDRIREKSNKSEYLDQRRNEIEQEITEDRRKFNQIAKTYGYNKMTNEQILRTLDEAEKKGLYHAKSDIDAMKRYLNRTVIEKDTGSAYSKPGKRWEVLEKDKSAFGKDIYKVMDEEGNVQWKDASSFYEKELNSKPKVDKHDLETLNRIADNYENENDYDMDDISKDYIKNRRNEMPFNKRNDEFIKNHTPKYKYVTEEEVKSKLGESCQRELDKMDDESLMEIYNELSDDDKTLEARMLREEVRTRTLSGKTVEKEPTLEFNGIKFNDKSDANRWLNQMIAEYGNTYNFPPEVRAKLNQLINKFGNTYFWRR